MINGIINVYKEKGYTSHDVVAKLRGILKQKKIGHTGTLDPDAEGVLPVCLGKATRVCDLLAEKDKVYEAVLLLGQKTDTQDTTGKILESSKVACTQKQAAEAILEFTGSYHQTPPMYSALKVNGKKLCDLARAGVEVERKAREVTIFSIEIQEMKLPRVKLLVHCSKGTYIRTLCHDIGLKLGCGGCMEYLLRTRVAEFQSKDAWKLSEIEDSVRNLRESCKQTEITREQLSKMVYPTEYVFLQYPGVIVKSQFQKKLYNGNPLEAEWLQSWNEAYEETKLRVYDERQSFIGIYQYSKEHRNIRPIKIFME